MKNLYQAKNIQNFFMEFKSRVWFILLFVVILISILGFRLHFVQIKQHERYITESNNNRIQIKAIPPVRGKIYDRQGNVLAGNTLFYNLGIIVEHTSNLKKTINRIQELIEVSAEDLTKFNKNRKNTRAYEPVVLRRKLNEAEIARIEVNQYQMPGVEILTQYDRHYILPVAFSHVVGYVGRINKDELESIDQGNYKLTSHIGKTGVEKSYEDILHGTTGHKKVETDSHGKILRTLDITEPVAGSDIFLTIDSRLQELALELMQDKRGSIIAINPENFEVLVMLSSPGFDTNLFVNGISHKDYNALRDSIDIPLFNRSVNGKYPPGSTIKPFVGLAGLESGIINSKTRVYCKGHYQIKNTKRKFRDWKKSGHGHTNIKKAITESCDVYFYDLAYNLGIDRIKPYINLFGFGRKTGIDLPYESQGFVPSKEWKKTQQNPKWNPGETLNVGIGQGKLQITPLQIAYATAALANYGKAYKPKVVHKIKAADSSLESPVTTIPPVLDQEIPIVNPKNWNNMIDAMQKVVHSARGTARRISVNTPYKIAGKTGTAQVFTVKQNQEYDEKKLAERLHDHALFIAFAPAANPKIAVAVIVENGKHGGSTAAPIAKSIMDKYLLELLPANEPDDIEDEKPT